MRLQVCFAAGAKEQLPGPRKSVTCCMQSAALTLIWCFEPVPPDRYANRGFRGLGVARAEGDGSGEPAGCCRCRFGCHLVAAEQSRV